MQYLNSLATSLNIQIHYINRQPNQLNDLTFYLNGLLSFINNPNL
jgi:hypothetical protein